MTSVLHPVGPEPSQRYWLRRVLVIVAVVAVIAVVTALIGNARGDDQQAVPAGPSSPAADTRQTGSPSALPTDDATSPGPTPSSDISSTSPTQKSSTATPSEQTTPSKTSSAETKKPAATPSCKASDLRATLRGKESLRPGQDTTFRLSLINGGPSTCRVDVTGKNFELKIYSGTDRIWSTNDCSRAVKSITKELPSEEAVEWQLTWNGRRSAKDCKNQPEIPRPGTYYATSQLEGAKPVQLAMRLRP